MTSTNYSYAKGKKNHVFSDFLKDIRQNNNLSQEQLCLHLKQHSSLCYNLDTITVSRWERGVNIPSLAKQAEIVELYGNELSSLYSCDKSFLNECSSLVAIQDSSNFKSNHPYYTNDEYQIEIIDINDDSFYLVLKMILRYEGNSSLKLMSSLEELDSLKNIRVSIATVFNGQIVGHGLYMETSAQNVLKLVNNDFNDLSKIVSSNEFKDHEAMLVLSSAGSTKQIENSIMSTYINQFSHKQNLRYLCFSVRDEGFIKKLSMAKLEPFKIRSREVNDKMIAIHSFLLSRSELMANRFLLKLAVISPKLLVNFIGNNQQGER